MLGPQKKRGPDADPGRRPSPFRGNGHRDGLHGERLLPYETARCRIYLPAYRWVLEHRTADLVERLRDLAGRQDVVLLGYTTNADVTDLTSPLSHAALIRLHLQDRWPDEGYP